MTTRTEILRDVMQLAWTMARQDQWSARAGKVRPFFAAALKRAWDAIKARARYAAERAVPSMSPDQARAAILTLECKDRLTWADMLTLDAIRAQLIAA